MDFTNQIIDIILNLDIYLGYVISLFGSLTYLILFLVVFCETGIIIVSFLPGDSLLFIIGALSAGGTLNLIVSIIILSLAAILGDTVNYQIGKYIGPKIFNKESSKLFNKNHLIEAHDFYEEYGGKTIILARFIPIIRAFAPFVAGIGLMPYKKFLSYNIIGGVAWVLIFTLIGYFFGNLPIVKDNFSLLVIAIVVISGLPIVLQLIMKKIKG
ncbi:MAG: DedA family protein [Methanobrevibacter arboriphilus]|uniref:DedA family protein n=1 Tax=Methanobrevibacter arboriphilus TaxID=39441 RepID=A0A843AGM3_METAZ|nr:DedA family protein [Methanobrevibacter arboriphilus]MBF4469043.1 DedA family protein [Methanobrevibacter arboriphilus]